VLHLVLALVALPALVLHQAALLLPLALLALALLALALLVLVLPLLALALALVLHQAALLLPLVLLVRLHRLQEWAQARLILAHLDPALVRLQVGPLLVLVPQELLQCQV
jgi:hypothetical protein